jgi:hypothetical protein
MKDLVMRVGFRATELAYTYPLTTPPPLCFSFHISHHHHQHHHHHLLVVVAHNSRGNGGGGVAAPRSSSMIHFDVLDNNDDDDHGADIDDSAASPRSSSTVALPSELLTALDDGGDGDDGDEDDQADGQMVMPSIAKQLLVFAKLYMVIFRSRRSESADDELLYSADADAKHEAIASGGLLLVKKKTKHLRISLRIDPRIIAPT